MAQYYVTQLCIKALKGRNHCIVEKIQIDDAASGDEGDDEGDTDRSEANVFAFWYIRFIFCL